MINRLFANRLCCSLILITIAITKADAFWDHLLPHPDVHHLQEEWQEQNDKENGRIPGTDTYSDIQAALNRLEEIAKRTEEEIKNQDKRR